MDREEWITVKLRIDSIERDGEVNAYLTLGISKGQLKGRVNENGVLELSGVIGSEVLGNNRFKISATVEEESLTDGTYLQAAGDYGSEVRGVFDSASWEE